MLITKYGIVLKRLKRGDIELVRQKRNSKEVRAAMFMQEEISVQQQQLWFDSVNNIYNNYFLIIYQGKPVGLINGKNVDYHNKTSEGGIFIWENEYINSFVPVAASVLLNDFSFYIAGFEKTFSRMRSENVQAIAYNRSMGYREVVLQNNTGEVMMELTRNDYTQNIPRIRKGLALLSGDGTPLTIRDFSFADDTAEDFTKLYLPLPPYITTLIREVLIRENRDPYALGFTTG